jgi:hypothetical protein
MQNIREEDAVRLMDNCAPHLTPVLIDLLSISRVPIAAFAPYTSKIFQLLCLTLFGALKRCGQYQLAFQDDAEIAHFIKKVYRDFQ